MMASVDMREQQITLGEMRQSLAFKTVGVLLGLPL